MATVLHIEDVQLLCEALASAIRRWPEFEYCGYALSGMDGVKRAEEQRPDAVILDIELPDTGCTWRKRSRSSSADPASSR